ncbi:MAG TPA: amidohydrolase family protein [Chloroflexota bacterium]|nr:amidohydrolase family protein [Chloroflexota bacterium]
MDLVVRQARIAEAGPLVDIGCNGGTIAAVQTSPSELSGATVLDAGGRVVLPGLVEPHIHLDKALLADRAINRSGTLAEAIQVTGAAKASFSRADISVRAEKTLRMCLRHGTTLLRAQTEFDPALGLLGLEVLLELKAAYADLVDIQVVAFPQEGIHQRPGTEDLFHEALRMGADVVGGVPYNDRSAHEHIDTCFALARQYGRSLSFHQDFADDARNLSIDYLATRTIDAGMQGRVEIGHATALGALPPERLARVAERLCTADISVVTLPMTDLHLGGRHDTHNVRRALAPVRALLAAGVNVAAGANNIRNAFTPYGTGDPLLTAFLLVSTAHLGGADTLPRVVDLVTHNAARAIGRGADYGVRPGARADLVVLETSRYADAAIDLPGRRWVVKSGRVSFSSETSSRWHLGPSA